ncbi:MAG: 4Fe-4S dicluster domain-containing protein [Alphaproteobacteria bacterium]|nr:4Fe-4S dicluster domain-containing protein [Alphaproteobacteria bacterium]
MPQLNRRDFLKALGITGGASALSACGLDDNRYLTPIEHVLPYVVKPDQITPGTPTFFATSILSGPHARSVTSRNREGRVVFVSHNRFATGRPAVTSAEFFELQKLYSPDRVQGPSKGGTAVSWEDGVKELSAAVQSAKASGKLVAYLGGYKSGAIVELLDAFTNGHAVYWEPLGYDADVAASEALFGQRVLPFYGVDKAGYVLSFGAPFLSGWGDADLADRYALARDPNVGHSVVRFALVSGHRDQTGVNADDWLACKPGAEVIVARALAAKVAALKGAAPSLVALIGNVSLDEAAQASGIAADALEAVAQHFASMKGVALPGGANGSTDLAVATYLLNLAVGEPELFHLGGYQGPIHGYDSVERLVADLKAGRVGVLLLDDANPVYALPDDLGVADAIGKAGLVVSVSSQPDETSALASLVLPTASAFEDWGTEAPRPGVHLARQPSMTALYDLRSLGDVLLVAGRAAGLATPAAAVDGEGEVAAAPASLGFGPTTWRAYVQAWWQANVWDGGGTFDAFWEKSLIEGVVGGAVQVLAPTPAATSYAFEAAAAVGGAHVLVTYTHPHRKDGRYANQPWAQEVPDPTTGQVWDSWVEMNKATADALGVVTGDQVEIAADGGTVQVGVQVLPSAADGVVALAFGQGHTGAGRYASVGANAAKLFSAGKDGHGATKWAPMSATVKATGARADLVSTFSQFGMSDEQRNFGVHVAADKLADVGDGEAHHPGELTGIHHLELDQRLLDKNITDFYGTPDHATYRFAMTVDTNACTGCGACSVACYAENNLPVVGKAKVREGREMGWIRINRYWEEDVGGHDAVYFVPMMCQQCGHAGCENVCPVLATYHNIDGLNAMVYNRCVGTRYCSNACPFSVRRFNYHTYTWPEPFNLQLNPDVSTRQMGVMEKCTFCVQRLRREKSAYKNVEGFTAVVPDEQWRSVPACVEACPTQALTFGNLKDPEGAVSKSRLSARNYMPLEELNVFGAINYLAQANFHDDPTAHHSGGHASEGHEASAEHGEHGGEPAGHDAAAH